jgi:KaiC/GvpD/RAD55 family RecA-like ATPase
MKSRYAVADALPNADLAALPAGTSVLVTGPAMVGKRDLAIQLLAAGFPGEEGLLCVTTSQNAAALLAEFEDRFPDFDDSRIGIVDCSGSDQRAAVEEVTTERVASPGDLTGISISTAKLLKRFANRDVSGVRHGLVSVSTLITYLDRDTVFKFLHIYTSRISDTDGIGVFTLDTESHDPQTVSTISSEFDAVVELRETDAGDREYRITGLAGTDRDWRSYD